jgi:hypothetical protein
VSVQARGLHQAHDHRRTLTGQFAAREEPSFSAHRNVGVILPMSGKKLRFSIAGMRSTGDVCSGNTSSTGLPATWCMSRSNQASSWLWRLGCSTLPRVQEWSWVSHAHRWPRSLSFIIFCVHLDLGQAPAVFPTPFTRSKMTNPTRPLLTLPAVHQSLVPRQLDIVFESQELEGLIPSQRANAVTQLAILLLQAAGVQTKGVSNDEH